MFRIGVFSRLTGVTIKALRHYDRIGLLKPAMVDRSTGYRSYSASQIDHLNRILALKDLGLSLEEIGKVLVEDPSASELRGMLRLKQSQLRQTISEEEARLARVEARIQQMEREGKLPVHEVIIRMVPEQYVLRHREVLACPAEIGPFFLKVNRALFTAGIESTGPWMALYWHGEYREYDLEVEAAIPVSHDIAGSIPLDDGQEMKAGTLPSARVASTMCRMESQIDVFNANRDLCAWIENNGFSILSAPCREVYSAAPQPGQPVIFEIQLEVTS